MKKNIFLILFVCILLTGCSSGVDLSKYDKIALTSDNLYKYIDAFRIAGSYDNKTVHLTLKFESTNSEYLFEDVSFDTKIIDCYQYDILLNTEVSDNIYVEWNRVSLDKKGDSKEFSVTQSVNNKIKRLCSSTSELFTSKNVKGYVYVPW